MVLSETEGGDGKSIIHECVTTALPAAFEDIAFWGTRAFLGDYYKTYGAGSEDVETAVRLASYVLSVLVADSSRSENDWMIQRNNTRTVLG